MPISNAWREKRFHICILAAVSITIMLFTVVHLRHVIPHRKHTGGDMNVIGEVQPADEVARCAPSFYADEILNCVHAGMKPEPKQERVRDKEGRRFLHSEMLKSASGIAAKLGL